MTRRYSRLELAAEQVLRNMRLAFEREYRFAPPRRWRADFRVWRGERSCLVEVEGVTRYGRHIGRHQSARGFEGDCRKYLAAALMGWVVLRFTENMIADGTMEAALREYFELRPPA